MLRKRHNAISVVVVSKEEEIFGTSVVYEKQ